MFDAKESFPERERRILAFWKGENIFAKSLENRKGSPLFSFYDGPPFATGLPHYGHLLAGTIKDVVLRYKTMKGFFAPRRFGWDCHGLPVENEIEKMQALSDAASIEDFGIAAFNEECRAIVLRYVKEWKKSVDRMGRWVDFDGAYRTMDPAFMESVWWVFGQLWKKGLIYEGYKVMPFSAKLGTPLSNFEANLNYRDVEDPSIVVAFPLIDEANTSLLAWTTTPWTLPAHLALIVRGDLDYVKVFDPKWNRHFIVGKRCLGSLFAGGYSIVDSFKGERLKGRRYEPPFSYFIDRASPRAFTILTDRFVGEEGTGIVHAAPAFGEVDFFVCKREGIEPICPIDQNGRFTEEVPDWQGRFVKGADGEIIARLKERGRLFRQEKVRHRYPFCWRSDTPLIYRVVETWFVAVEKIKERLIEANESVHWVPSHLQKGRFGKWLESARDWAISRNRYWGTPLPIWRNERGDAVVISSLDELEKRVGKRVGDLHRHHIDALTFEEGGEVYARIPEVFDCWFESGSMPYAQYHYPFENRERALEGFPADFIAEGLDQTRGWFYTLNVLSVALFDRPAFKHVVVNGIVLAEDGTKMSKRLKNYPEPEAVFEKYGADATRLYLLKSAAVHGDDLRFSEKGVELVLRELLIPLWHAYIFFSTYAPICAWVPDRDRFPSPRSDMDRWILSAFYGLVRDVESGMERYALHEGIAPLIGFVDRLTNWYIRRSRSRFWSSEATDDRREAFETLYTVLTGVAKVAAPFLPFLSDAIYRNLREDGDPQSVHLLDFPDFDATRCDLVLERQMESVQRAVSMGHALRKRVKIKVRQPLRRAYFISPNRDLLEELEALGHLIRDELNVKGLEFRSDEGEFAMVRAKPNFRTLGKRAGSLMQEVKLAIESLDRKAIEGILMGREFSLQLEGGEFPVAMEDLLVERRVKEGVAAWTEGEITVVLDTDLDEELLLEGMARELINRVNRQRRDEGFEVTDRIKMRVDTTPFVQRAVAKHRPYILAEVLAREIVFEENRGTVWDVLGERTVIALKKF